MLLLHQTKLPLPKKVSSKAQKEERRKIWKIRGYEFLTLFEKFHKYTALHEDCLVFLTNMNFWRWFKRIGLPFMCSWNIRVSYKKRELRPFFLIGDVEICRCNQMLISRLILVFKLLHQIFAERYIIAVKWQKKFSTA